MMKFPRFLMSAAILPLALTAPAAFADNVRVAFIEALSGPFAPVGQNVLKSWQSMADLANREKWAGGHTFEFNGFDSKGSPQEALQQLKSAI
ncbi:MAG: ABC transporter substrate-binding protein, partial [Proteobacteria bacterium]|nr:ABC transporter substrate-binding protein [Pseudomonadota bacterium]